MQYLTGLQHILFDYIKLRTEKNSVFCLQTGKPMVICNLHTTKERRWTSGWI